MKLHHWNTLTVAKSRLIEKGEHKTIDGERKLCDGILKLQVTATFDFNLVYFLS